MNLKPLIIILISFYALAAMQSCDTRLEGCNDPLAENFDPEADKNCCCTYFKLQLNLNHYLDTTYTGSSNSADTTFKYFTKYLDANNDSFEVQDMAIFISEVRLVNAFNETYTINDTLEVILQDSSNTYVPDDFYICTRNSLLPDLGDFTNLGDYTKVRILLGIQPNYNASNSTIQEETHPLSDQSGMYSSNLGQYYTSRTTFINSSTADTFVVALVDTMQLQFDYPISAVDDLDIPIPLTVNYGKIFEGITFATDDSTAIANKMQNNLRAAFTIP